MPGQYGSRPQIPTAPARGAVTSMQQRPGTTVTKDGFQPSGSVRNENIPSQASVGEARRMNTTRRDLNAAAHTKLPITILDKQKLGDRLSPIQDQLTATPMLDKVRGQVSQGYENQRIKQSQEIGGALNRRLTALGQQNSGAGLGLMAKTQQDVNDQIDSQKSQALNQVDQQQIQLGESSKDRLFNIAQSGSQRDLQQAQMDLQVAAANGDQRAKQQLVKFEQLAKLREFDIAEKQGRLQQEADQFNKRMSERAASSQETGNALGAVGTAAGLALAFSDERAKKNIKDDDGEVQEFLDNIGSKSFEYLDPKKPGAAEGKRYGIMAQDLEKSEMGKSLVKETKQGKMVDTAQGTMSTMSALGQINRRLKALESMLEKDED